MSFAYMPLYTGDYLRDTRHLTPLKHGIYVLALMYCWDSKGPMPLDEQECAGICNCRSADEVEAMRYVLSRYFVVMDDGKYNKRMSEEVVRHERLSKTFSEAGLKSAEARRNKARAGTRAAQANVEPRLNVGSTKAEPRSETPSPSLFNSNTSEAIASGTGVPDSADIIFGLGIPLLTAANVSDRNARSMLGLMRKTNGDEAVIDAVRRCAEEKPLQPVAWLQAALKSPSVGAGGGRRSPDYEPEWRRLQRERNEAFLGPAASARKPKPTTTENVIDMEPANATQLRLG